MTRNGSIRAASVAAVVALAGFTSAPARAGDAVLSEALFREGRSLMDAGDYEKGCPKLQASYTEDPATGTLLALALCEEKAGHLASAWANYVDAASRSHQERRKDREKAANERVRALEPRLSKLTLQVDGGTAALAGLTVTRDGQPVTSAAFGSPVPTDGGLHVIEAKAQGKQPFRTSVTVRAEGDLVTVAVGPLADLPPVMPASAPDTLPGVDRSGPTPEPAEPPPSSRGLGTLQWVGIGGMGLGVVGLGAATIFTFKAKGLNDDSNSQGCSGRLCPPSAADTRRDARSAGNLATVFAVAGGVLAASGLTLFLVGGGREEGKASASLSLTGAPAPGGGGLLAEGRF